MSIAQSFESRTLASNSELTFCILTFDKTPWLKKSLMSIQRHCKIDYSVKILSQGRPDVELTNFLKKIDVDKIELLTSEVNLGCDGGRKFLAQHVATPYAMMLDDDMYLTETSMRAFDVLEKNIEVGAVSMPQYSPQGRLISPGGMDLLVRRGVIHMYRPTLDASSWIEIQHINGGAMLFRTEMRKCFMWDDRAGALEDLDKSLQILRSARWKQAIAPRGRLIHDRSWVGKNPNYERTRFNGMTLYRNYEYFRRKWGLRLNLRAHVLYEAIYPLVTLTRFPITVSQIDKFSRTAKRRLPF